MMNIHRFHCHFAVAGLLAAVLLTLPSLSSVARAEDSQLSVRQSSLAGRYQRLEELLLRLAEVEAAENPERSALLRRAARQSRDKFVLEKMRSASESLKTQEFQKAVDNQNAAAEELALLLKLLQSEDRSKRLRDEKERYQKLAKEIKRAIRAQQSTRARTENGAEFDELESEQESIGDRTERLADELADEEQSEGESSQESSESSEKSNESEKSESGSDKDKQSSKDPSEEKESGDADSDKKPGDDQEKPGDDPKDPQSKPSEKEPSDKSDQAKSDSAKEG